MVIAKKSDKWSNSNAVYTLDQNPSKAIEWTI